MAAAASIEASLSTLLERWPGVLFRQRPDMTIEFASPRIKELTGYSLEAWQREGDLFWKALHELDSDEFRKQLQLVAKEPAGINCTFRLRHGVTGRVAYVSEYRRAVSSTGRVQAYEGFWLDVTRHTLSERRLATAAWKETLGLLTLGLAHDFNNVLAGILALSESFLAQVQADHPFHEGLSLIKRNTQQAAQLVQRITQLHRGKTGNRSYQNLNEIVTDSVDLLRKVVPKRIDLATQLVPAQLPLYVDAVELQQVLINLALNAADAMVDRGELAIRTSLHHDLPALGHHVGVLPRLPAVCLTVQDTGCGIKERHLASIFDPFFTTKPMNRGSGLGLYNARLFAEKHQGAISVESREDVGTAFCVWLPQADFTEAEQAVELSSRRRRSLLLAGHAGNLLDRTAEFLRQNNYHVVVGAADAEDLLRSSDYVFDGVMVLAEPREPQCLAIMSLVRQQKLPLKVIVKTIGCNQDELDTQYLLKADLIISADLPQDTILEKLAAVFDLRSAQ